MQENDVMDNTSTYDRKPEDTGLHFLMTDIVQNSRGAEHLDVDSYSSCNATTRRNTRRIGGFLKPTSPTYNNNSTTKVAALTLTHTLDNQACLLSSLKW